jgi:hypothetical protein
MTNGSCRSVSIALGRGYFHIFSQQPDAAGSLIRERSPDGNSANNIPTAIVSVFGKK